MRPETNIDDRPTALYPEGSCELELEAIQHKLPFRHLRSSDVECLNLNITVPHGCTASSKLPVFFFIHGGGFVMGANSWPQYELRDFVELSVKNGKPIIAIGAK